MAVANRQKQLTLNTGGRHGPPAVVGRLVCRASISVARSSAPTRSSIVGHAFGRGDVAAPFAQRPDGPVDVALDVAHVGRLAGGVRLAGPGPARRTVLMSNCSALALADPRRSCCRSVGRRSLRGCALRPYVSPGKG